MYNLNLGKQEDIQDLKDRLQIVEEYAYQMDKILNYIITDMEVETGYIAPKFLVEHIKNTLYTTVH